MNQKGDSMTRPAQFILRLFMTTLLGLIATNAVHMVAQAASPATITVSGKILGASGKHTVHVALWDASGFLTKPVQELQLKPQAGTAFQFKVTSGAWAISAYEDENENGKLDFGIFAPKEPSGFWRPFHGWHKPRFSEVSSTVSSDVSNADIELRK